MSDKTPAERLYAIVEQGLCIGCGLCQSVAGKDSQGKRRVSVVKTSNGYLTPVIESELDHQTVDRIYATCPGTRVSTLATDEGLFVKNDKGFILKGYYPGPEVSEENERIKQIANACGWQLYTAPELEEMRAPTPEELKLLRSFDPEGVFLG